MNLAQSLGVVALIVGAALLAVGYSSSEAPVDQISNTLTGRYTDNTMWYIIAGVAMLVTGGLMAAFGRRI